MRSALVMVLGVLAGGCPSAKTVTVDQLPASGLALRWDIGGRFGGETLRVDHDGSVEYRAQGDPTVPPEVRRGKIKREKVAEILTRMAETSICDLRSQRTGEPDEARGTLTINAAVFGCSVELWDNEWGQRAPVAQDIISQLRNVAKVPKGATKDAAKDATKQSPEAPPATAPAAAPKTAPQ